MGCSARFSSVWLKALFSQFWRFNSNETSDSSWGFSCGNQGGLLHMGSDSDLSVQMTIATYQQLVILINQNCSLRIHALFLA